MNQTLNFKDNLNKLTPQWVTGIVDSEGNFSILSQKTNSGVKFTLAVKVTQKEHSLGILLSLKEFFKCGNIYIDNRKENAYKFSVNKIDEILNIIIPHFDNYPLLSSKRLDYQDFRKVAFLINNKLHMSKQGQEEILLIKNNMNSSRSFDERWNFLKSCEPIQLNNEWVQAFIDGEGSFQFGISNTVNRGKAYTALAPTLEIAQSNHDILLLNAFIQFFGCGYLKPKYDISDLQAAKNSRIVNRLIINQSSTVIDFIEKYPLYTRKQLDYLDWKNLIKLKADRVYETPEGLQKMKYIKASMNKGRDNIISE